MARKRIGVDLDNTLCIGQHWDNEDQCFDAKPIQKMVDYISKIYKDNFIIIYTARQNWLMSVTFEWLDKHNVKYHAVMNKKCPVEILIDDTAFIPKL